MGIAIETTSWYSCWRNRAQHSGKSPLRLIMKLLRVSYGTAREIAGLGDDYVDPEGFNAMAAKLMNRDGSTGRKEELQRRVLRLDRDFAVIEPRGRTRHHYEYLREERGFNEDGDVEKLGKFYGVCAGVSGVFAGRIILPYYQDGDLVTWTARAIGAATVRYRDLEIEQSILAPKQTLYNHDAMLQAGKALTLVEGPLDALKIDFYGRLYHVRAVALSTNSIKDAQAFLLQDGVERFTRRLVMMDNASQLSVVDTMRMRQELHFIPNIESVAVPFGKKDGGALTPNQVREWARSL